MVDVELILSKFWYTAPLRVLLGPDNVGAVMYLNGNINSNRQRAGYISYHTKENDDEMLARAGFVVLRGRWAEHYLRPNEVVVGVKHLHVHKCARRTILIDWNGPSTET